MRRRAQTVLCRSAGAIRTLHLSYAQSTNQKPPHSHAVCACSLMGMHVFLVLAGAQLTNPTLPSSDPEHSHYSSTHLVDDRILLNQLTKPRTLYNQVPLQSDL
ncbi:unnamed protein product [Rodentolepis nana]|uniref:Secreted protein n=1 Tax=Rodentolepis nana TaxID=102285 RepID=A0A0R3T2M2_RODNA|nr:unnamed protein product [Rodentolepis nana]